MTDDPLDLQRFVDAQAPVYERVRTELRNGRKHSHWMWFIFPQIAGLGHSAMAQRYAISSLREAEAYLKHPVLGSRLRECVRLILQVNGKSAYEIRFAGRYEVSFLRNVVRPRRSAGGYLSGCAGEILRRR